MKKLLQLILVAAAAYLAWRGFHHLRDRAVVREAERRVRTVLEMKESNAEKAAVAAWYDGSLEVDAGRLAEVQRDFEDFWASANLVPPSAWSIEQARLGAGDVVTLTMVSGRDRRTIVVEKKRPLRVVYSR